MQGVRVYRGLAPPALWAVTGLRPALTANGPALTRYSNHIGGRETTAANPYPIRSMKTFNLPNGKTLSRDATHCVAILRGNGRWTHRWFKSLKGAENEYRFWRNCGQHVRDYNDIDNVKLIKGN